MQMNDSQRIPAAKEKVWAALNDPAILKQCIPGCQSLEMSSPTDMTATVVFRVGPVKATFGGKVTLSDLDPPNSYRISGEGSGGVAGFAKGGATVRLESESPDVTILHYEVDAQIGGKLAQLGQRLIDSTSKKLAGEFFAAFGEVVGGTAEAPAEVPTEAEGGKERFSCTSKPLGDSRAGETLPPAPHRARAWRQVDAVAIAVCDLEESSVSVRADAWYALLLRRFAPRSGLLRRSLSFGVTGLRGSPLRQRRPSSPIQSNVRLACNSSRHRRLFS